MRNARPSWRSRPSRPFLVAALLRRRRLAFTLLLLLLAIPTMAEAPRVAFTQRVVTGEANGTVAVAAADLDGDGDEDLLVGSIVDKKLAWHENLGEPSLQFMEHILTVGQEEPTFVGVADVDGDGDADPIVTVCFEDKIAWYENRGGTPSIFSEHVLEQDPDGVAGPLQGAWDCPQVARGVDLDLDGDTDLLVAAPWNNRVGWLRNEGGVPLTFTAHEIASPPAPVYTPAVVDAADVDGDGDLDVLSAGRRHVSWHESTGGSPPAFSTHTILYTPGFDAGLTTAVIPADVDGDGDIDLFASHFHDDSVSWMENVRGSPPTFVRHVIAADPDGPNGEQGLADGPRSLAAGDFDGDGDVDLACVSQWDGKVIWFESDGESPPSFLGREITTKRDSPEAVIVTDMDGDGDPDVVTASFKDDTVAIYVNRAVTREK